MIDWQWNQTNVEGVARARAKMAKHFIVTEFWLTAVIIKLCIASYHSFLSSLNNISIPIKYRMSKVQNLTYLLKLFQVYWLEVNSVGSRYEIWIFFSKCLRLHPGPLDYLKNPKQVFWKIFDKSLKSLEEKILKKLPTTLLGSNFVKLEIKPIGLGSRIRDMEAESHNWLHSLLNLW